MRYQFEGFVLDPGRAELTRHGAPVHLSAKPFALLTLLATKHPDFVPRDEIHSEVWKGIAVSDASLSTAVKDLRRGLAEAGGRADLVRTIHGRGFRLNVSSVQANATDVSWAQVPGPASATERWETDWPARERPLAWTMANHWNVRRAVSMCLQRDASHRYLPIQGPSESGKSLITKQLLADVLRWRGFACGRLDFKGTIGIEAQVYQFAHDLRIETPSSPAGTTAKLSYILRALLAARRPALLIFDTFEAAGDADPWVHDHLLIALIRAPLLRVVVAGQRVPARGGMPWDAETAPSIVLGPISPEDWLEYGRAHRSDVTLDFVRQVHRYCHGRPSVLAQLLGPTG